MGERRNLLLLLLTKENVLFAQLLVQAGGNWVQWGYGCPLNLNQLTQVKHICFILMMKRWSWVGLGVIKSSKQGHSQLPTRHQGHGVGTEGCQGWGMSPLLPICFSQRG